jgi:hypothetical protein
VRLRGGSWCAVLFMQASGTPQSPYVPSVREPVRNTLPDQGAHLRCCLPLTPCVGVEAAYPGVLQLLLVLQHRPAASAAAVGPAGWSRCRVAGQAQLLLHRGCRYLMRQQQQVAPAHPCRALQLLGRPELLQVADQLLLMKLGADARLAASQPLSALRCVVG